jgi:hypothetical protein
LFVGAKAALIQPFRPGRMGCSSAGGGPLAGFVGVFDNNPVVLAYSPT